MGTLTLIPTPIDDESPLESVAFNLLSDECLKDESLILVEEHKACRRRWLHWGLPREAIEKFILFNEHTREDESFLNDLISKLKSGKKAYLMSDCGLPAFCDPGVKLVRLCHEHKVQVTSTPFPNSISLAMALSGIDHDRFSFEGFVPKGGERASFLNNISRRKEVIVLMDTPYRMEKLIKELSDLMPNRRGFLGIDLNQDTELLLHGKLSSIYRDLPKDKREFIVILDKN